MNEAELRSTKNANYYAKANHIDLLIGHKAGGVRHIGFCFKYQYYIFESIFYKNRNKTYQNDNSTIKSITNYLWKYIAPLLVIPYIENTFKYGISITQESFIDLKFQIKDQKLSFSCRNSIIKQFDKLEVGTSTGIENTPPPCPQLSTQTFIKNFQRK